jgi:L-threonylcarbamoyladenylate synthase
MLQTHWLSVNAAAPEAAVIAQAATIVRGGGLVAFPTETVYGLGADALNAQAVARIFAAKERPAYDPLIVHIADVQSLALLAVDMPALVYPLARRFWPGPLTLVLPKSAAVPEIVTAGGATVAVRCPRHPVALALIRAAATPIAAPSANRFSHTSPTLAQHVWDDLHGRIEMILDGGATPIGVESTVLDLAHGSPRLLRPGGVPVEALEAEIGPVLRSQPRTNKIDNDVGQAPLASPGLLDRHYAPQAPLLLVVCEQASLPARFGETVQSYLRAGKRVGVLLASEDATPLAHPAMVRLDLGSLQALDGVAARLFAALRQLDAAGVEVIVARSFPGHGLGLAINDRLRRAAQRVV